MAPVSADDAGDDPRSRSGDDEARASLGFLGSLPPPKPPPLRLLAIAADSDAAGAGADAGRPTPPRLAGTEADTVAGEESQCRRCCLLPSPPPPCATRSAVDSLNDASWSSDASRIRDSSRASRSSVEGNAL